MNKKKKAESESIAILGGGNIGTAMARGFVATGNFPSSQITITRRNPKLLDDYAENGFLVHADNSKAVAESEVVVIAVQPQQLVALLEEIRDSLEADKHTIISVVTGVTIAEISQQLGNGVPVVRAMPNTAIAICQSMTCLASAEGDSPTLEHAQHIFDSVGKTLVVNENHMIPATALAACGVAFFLRSIRAASQGGIEIGFHTHEALLLAAQTALGAASLVLDAEEHPESEIDKVTTPRGCTIAGLNEMEHQGFSSAMIKGILTSAEMADSLYKS
ncbi:MAG: pyrroline-5-carboxylate reductase [Candidatus Marinimicrobia bacterium]|nr:pyrroline-5-carboxylate reductase [Candidatus Neomarinimicrobiota bacterium]MDP6593032.1 pyrroline-5-carboxylate reductase [Candidatus Neomarinimicrobiota bacterium]MDP6835743.1 pyrroline-5-carboxylate reductase [Candidatus Neomarinimicrobiota bacterium]|tara:strand:- start:6876 stop:7703 length:828 start_codon:yes stop_codon:yes gene_type:complete